MSIAVIERPPRVPWVLGFDRRRMSLGVSLVPPELILYDPNGRDGEWHALITLPHETVEWDGLGVPLFEGDVERREWEAARRSRGLALGATP